jgi:hypothetical protein
MGHLRLGRLPKTLRWTGVVELLSGPAVETPAVARATVEAADHRLRALGSDPSLTYCFWLLTRITWASRSADFATGLADAGVVTQPETSALAFISQVAEQTRSEIGRFSESGPFGDLASLALRRALSETVGQQGSSLFGSSLEDLQRACRAYSTRNQFGILARRFFGDFLARTLRYFVDKEVSNHVGPGHGLSDVGESRQFSEALDLYARQSARIMEDFAAGWYSKHNWESKGQISLEDARGFVAVAMRKLRMELKRERAGT